jgi:hypothetical protein
MNPWAWIETLKVGDNVGVGTDSRGMRIKTVEAIHKLHVVVGGAKFRRYNGQRAGDSGGWRKEKLWELTPERLQALRVRMARARIDMEGRSPLLTDEAAIRVAALICAELAAAEKEPTDG